MMVTLDYSKIRCFVVGSLRPGKISLHVCYGYGHNNGGAIVEFDVKEIPVGCRFPNTLLWIDFDGSVDAGYVRSVEVMSEKDAKDNRPSNWPELDENL